MLLSKLEVLALDGNDFGSAQTATDEHGQYSAVAHVSKLRTNRCGKQLLALFCA
jgi:hypothetical protein